MKKTRFAEKLIAFALRQANSDISVTEVCRKMHIATGHLRMVLPHFW